MVDINTFLSKLEENNIEFEENYVNNKLHGYYFKLDLVDVECEVYYLYSSIMCFLDNVDNGCDYLINSINNMFTSDVNYKMLKEYMVI